MDSCSSILFYKALNFTLMYCSFSEILNKPCLLDNTSPDPLTCSTKGESARRKCNLSRCIMMICNNLEQEHMLAVLCEFITRRISFFLLIFLNHSGEGVGICENLECKDFSICSKLIIIGVLCLCTMSEYWKFALVFFCKRTSVFCTISHTNKSIYLIDSCWTGFLFVSYFVSRLIRFFSAKIF